MATPYKFKCIKCGHVEIKQIPMNEYSKLKHEQTCSKCNAKSERVIEFEGGVSGGGDGWYGGAWMTKGRK